jgi:hypothetical protein
LGLLLPTIRLLVGDGASEVAVASRGGCPSSGAGQLMDGERKSKQGVFSKV